MTPLCLDRQHLRNAIVDTTAAPYRGVQHLLWGVYGEVVVGHGQDKVRLGELEQRAHIAFEEGIGSEGEELFAAPYL